MVPRARCLRPEWRSFFTVHWPGQGPSWNLQQPLLFFQEHFLQHQQDPFPNMHMNWCGGQTSSSSCNLIVFWCLGFRSDRFCFGENFGTVYSSGNRSKPAPHHLFLFFLSRNGPKSRMLIVSSFRTKRLADMSVLHGTTTTTRQDDPDSRSGSGLGFRSVHRSCYY